MIKLSRLYLDRANKQLLLRKTSWDVELMHGKGDPIVHSRGKLILTCTMMEAVS
jgi:hypothetical protein